MRRIIFSLLLFYSVNIFASDGSFIDDVGLTPLQVNQSFDEQNSIDLANLLDLVVREEKIDKCVDDYIKKQSHSYTRIVQNNLYDLMNNFDRVISKISGNKPAIDEISYDEKIKTLARTQCEVYNTIGVLK